MHDPYQIYLDKNKLSFDSNDYLQRNIVNSLILRCLILSYEISKVFSFRKDKTTRLINICQYVSACV